ncbi:MAG: hypothetical protein P8077_06075 [Gammaproteobacteria bacterium]
MIWATWIINKIRYHSPSQSHRTRTPKALPTRRLSNKHRIFLAAVLTLAIEPASAFLYPYDFGSFANQPRSLIYNAGLLFKCERSSAYTMRLRYNDFQPVGLRSSDKPSDPTDGNAIESEVGFCHKQYPWLSLGLFAAISSFNGNQSTKSLNNPIVFPLHKTYLPVLSGAFSVKVIENVHIGFSAQFFETLHVDTRIEIAEEFRAIIKTQIAFDFNWNVGAAFETPWGIVHGGYQPAFEAGLDVSVVTPLNLEQVNALPISLTLDLISLEGALDYRPATWQIGWIGQVRSLDTEAGILISKWDDLGAKIFVQPSDPLGISDLLITQNELRFRTTIDPYLIVRYPLSDTLTLQGGYAHFASPIIQDIPRRPAVSGDIHSFKLGATLKTYFHQKPMYLEGHLIYGIMPRQDISGGGQLSGNYFTGRVQVSFPF